MPSDAIPTRDTLFGQYLKNFAMVASANSADLPLSTAQITALQDYAVEFNAAMLASTAMKAKLKSTLATKDTAREEAEHLVRACAQFVLKDPEVLPELKAKLGMNLTTNYSGPVAIPDGLVAEGFSNGQIKLRWNRNGNSFATVFIIEAKVGRSSKWTYISMTTKTRFTDSTQTLGTQIAYRIIARRSEKSSGPSNVATVYIGLGMEDFELRKVA